MSAFYSVYIKNDLDSLGDLFSENVCDLPVRVDFGGDICAAHELCMILCKRGLNPVIWCQSEKEDGNGN